MMINVALNSIKKWINLLMIPFKKSEVLIQNTVIIILNKIIPIKILMITSLNTMESHQRNWKNKS